MRYLNQKGYSLLLTLLISLLFTLLAVTLLSLTMSGVLQTQVRHEVVQLQEVTDRGLDHISQDIQMSLKNVVGTSGIPRDQFIVQLNSTLNNYLCTSSNVSRTGDTGEYTACISNIEPVLNSDGTVNELRKQITLKSVGNINGREREIETVMEVGSQTVPDALRYAVGAHDLCPPGSSSCTRLNGEGNMFLHGGVDITGDLKVDGDLITSERAYAFFSGNEQWIDSQKPTIRGASVGQPGRLVLGGNVYTFNSNSFSRPLYSNHILRNSFPSPYQLATTNLSNAFSVSPNIVAREPVRDPVNISSQSNAYYYNWNAPNVQYMSLTNTNPQLSNQNYQNARVFIGRTTTSWFSSNVTNLNGTLTLSGTNTFGNLVIWGDTRITSSTNAVNRNTFQNGLFVDGNLTIGNSSNSYNPNQYAKLQLEGPIFVDGDLLIKGADAEINALVYVTGSVVIENTRLNGLTRNGVEGSLIVFSNGTINIRNNSVNEPSPSNIRGFFYSENALEMFGVGSNLKINGGVSARRIVLNGIRGDASNSNFDQSKQYGSNFFFHNGPAQLGKNSRLQIIYNPDIINTFSDLKSQEPIIMNLDPPRVIERKVN